MMQELTTLLTSKTISGGLTPIFDSAARVSGRAIVPRSSYGGGYMNYNLFANTPQWRKVSGMQDLLNWFHYNPVFYAVVMIKAREYGNLRIEVVNRNSNHVEPENTKKELPKKLYAMFNKPNVLQSRWEFFMQRKIFEEVCGNSFTYGNFRIGYKPDVNNLVAMWNIWPGQMQFRLNGMYFEATKIEEIIKDWKFEAGRYKKEWEPFEIMHRNKPNTDIGGDGNGIIFGKSPAESLVRPLSNIDMAYESRNVIMKNRGMSVILSSNKQDESGNIPLLDGEKKIVEKSLEEYGLLEGQKPFWFSPYPLSATTITQDVRRLGLFEEIATDGMTVCNGYGVPEVLLKLYLQGATFENQEASLRRLYQGALIPEAEDEFNSWNAFLGLEDTDWKVRPSFGHIPCLQESENQKIDTLTKKSTLLMKELDKALITPAMYWERMGYGTIPPDVLAALEERKANAQQILNQPPKPQQ